MNRIAKYLALAAFVVGIGSAATASAANPTAPFVPAGVGCHDANTSCFILLPPSVLTPADAGACANATPGSITQVRFLVTDPGAEAMYRTALSAFLAGKKIVVSIPQTCVAGGFPGVDYLFVTN